MAVRDWSAVVSHENSVLRCSVGCCHGRHGFHPPEGSYMFSVPAAWQWGRGRKPPTSVGGSFRTLPRSRHRGTSLAERATNHGFAPLEAEINAPRTTRWLPSDDCGLANERTDGSRTARPLESCMVSRPGQGGTYHPTHVGCISIPGYLPLHAGTLNRYEGRVKILSTNRARSISVLAFHCAHCGSIPCRQAGRAGPVRHARGTRSAR